MKFTLLSLALLAAQLSAPVAARATLPGALIARIPNELVDVDARALEDAVIARDVDAIEDLWKRKGGGSSGGRGGGSSSSGSSSGSSSSGSSSSGSSSSGSSSSGSSSSSSGSSRGGSSSSSSSGSTSGSSSSSSSSSSGKGLGSSTSSTGGRTTTGSGTKPAYGGGTYYGGGASVPYSAGVRSPSGIAPFVVGAGAASLLLWHPLAWPYGAYWYTYPHPWTYHNASAPSNSTNTTVTTRDTTTGADQTTPVSCLCAAYAECGCDYNDNSTYISDLLGNGSYAALNQTLVTVADVNGTTTILINGTLENGTTAAGGTDSPNAAMGFSESLMRASGYWTLASIVGCIITFA